MSGRFIFTAGNTLTAAQMNTNVMDGIPYKIVAGTTPTITGNGAVTYPVSFTTGVVPIVTAIVAGTASNGTSVTLGSSSATGATFYVWVGAAASTTAKTIYYTAIQMTSTTGSGNS